MGSPNLWSQWRTVSAADDPGLVSSFWTENQSFLTAIAQKWLDRMLEKSPSSDSASSVTAFEVFCLSNANSAGESLRGADELWRLIASIVMAQQPRSNQSGRMTDLSAINPTNDVSSGKAVPVSIVPSNLAQLMTDELRRMLQLLSDVDLEVVVIAKLCGSSDDALGTEMDYTRRTIQRMLRLIRSIWSDELEACRNG